MNDKNGHNEYLNRRGLKNTPFRAPKGYFEGLFDSVMVEIRVEELRKQTGSSNHNQFRADAEYFTALPSVVMNRIKQEEQSSRPVAFKGLIAGAAAAIGLLLMVGSMNYYKKVEEAPNLEANYPQTKAYKSEVNQIDYSNEAMEKVLEELSTDDLIAYSEEVDIPLERSSIAFDIQLIVESEQAEPTIAEEDIENYLITTDIDIDLIMDEL